MRITRLGVQLKGHYNLNCNLQPNIDIEKLKGNLQKIFANVANNWNNGRLDEELKKVKRSIISEKINGKTTTMTQNNVNRG